MQQFIETATDSSIKQSKILNHSLFSMLGNNPGCKIIFRLYNNPLYSDGFSHTDTYIKGGLIHYIF